MCRRPTRGFVIAAVEQPTQLLPQHPKDNAGGIGYARSLDLDDNLLIVVGLRAGGPVPDAGAVFVYRRAQGRWQQEAKLMASDGATRDMFGHWVGLDNGTVVSGAFRHSVGGTREVGATYVYRQVDGTWTEVEKIVPSEPAQQSFTAYGLAIDDDTVVMSRGTRADPAKSHYFWTFQLAG